MRIPAALSEADAHLGLANRLALPFAKRVFLAYPLEGRDGAALTASSAARSRPARARSRSDEAREIFELPPDGPVLLVAGALAGARSINETVDRGVRRGAGRRSSTSRASATTGR